MLLGEWVVVGGGGMRTQLPARARFGFFVAALALHTPAGALHMLTAHARCTDDGMYRVSEAHGSFGLMADAAG